MISKTNTLKVLEVLTDRIGRDRAKFENASTLDMIRKIASTVEEFAETTPEELAEILTKIASYSVIAVASMVAGVEETKKEDTIEDLANRARQKLIERAQKSNIIISNI